MNVWRLTAANTMSLEQVDPVPEAGKRKIRITKVFLNRSDALLFSGAKKMRYPRIPGRFAVGLISDEGSAHFPKGARVLVHTAFPAPSDGVEKRDYTEEDILLRGYTADGFLRDFIWVPEEELSLLPESVSDEKALLIQHIALANAARLHFLCIPPPLREMPRRRYDMRPPAFVCPIARRSAKNPAFGEIIFPFPLENSRAVCYT